MRDERRRQSRKPLAVALVAFILPLFAAAGLGGGAAIFADSALSPSLVGRANTRGQTDIMRAVDGIPGWVRTEAPRVFTREGLYGHIDGGAELVLQYGFEELSVHVFEPAEGAAKEIVLEIYRMGSGEAAFGLYSTKLEGEEERWPGIASDHWIAPGQLNLVKSEYLVNILASDCTDDEVGDFAAAVERKIPGEGTVRPAGMNRLPDEGMVRGSGRYIKGALAARNESPLLDGDFWGFAEGRAEAYSARYGAAPALSKLIIVEFLGAPEADTGAIGEASEHPAAAPDLAEKVIAVFNEYLRDVRLVGDTVEGRNQIGRWFLFRAEGRFAALVLGEPDEAAARARLDEALRTAEREKSWKTLM